MKCPYRPIMRFERKEYHNVHRPEGGYSRVSSIEPCSEPDAHTKITDFPDCLYDGCGAYNDEYGRCEMKARSPGIQPLSGGFLQYTKTTIPAEMTV